MTEADQNAAIGKLVSDFSDSKKRRAALLATAQTMRADLRKAADALNSLDFVPAFSDGHDRGNAMTSKEPKIDEYSESQRVRDLLDELRTVASETRTLRQRLKEAGLSIE